jgi:predicted molibdopterin-dependent oxidoreductase YjgC
VTEQSPALRFLKPQQRIEIAPGDADRLGLSSGDDVTVSSNGTSVEARVAIRERMQEGAAFLIEGTEEGNANALLNGGARMVEIRKVEAE